MKAFIAASVIAAGLASCQSVGGHSASEPVHSDANYQAFAQLVSGKWRATPVQSSRNAPIPFELSVSPLLSVEPDAGPGDHALCIVTITTSEWSANACVYKIDRTEGDQLFEPGYLVEACEGQAVPPASADAAEWSFVVSDAKGLQGVTRAPAGTARQVAATHEPPKLDLCWRCEPANG